MSISRLAFSIAIVGLLAGGLMGVAAIWVDGFWLSGVAWKLMATDVVLTITSAIVALVTRGRA